jgi:hypothetical protein
MNLTSLAFPYTTHERAVDGNHHFPVLLRPPLPIRCRRAEGNNRERMPHRLLSVLEGSLLTSEHGPY